VRGARGGLVQNVALARAGRVLTQEEGGWPFSLYTILFDFKALSAESIILLLPPPTCKAYTIALLLHDHCAIYARPPTPPLYGIHHTILVMAMSCKGQVALEGVYRYRHTLCEYMHAYRCLSLSISRSIRISVYIHI